MQQAHLLAGIQRIEQARASLKISGANLIPSIKGSSGASRSKTNLASGKNNYSSSLSVGVNISYELDLFGSNRANILAAEAELDNTIFTQSALDLTIMGDVATSYFTLVNLRERLVIADNNLANSREVLHIIETRVREDLESDLELAQQKIAIASSKAVRISLTEQIKNADNVLAVLLGKPPNNIEIKRQMLNGLNVPVIVTGQPSELLEHRPDLLAAETLLFTANANIKVAKAAFFPSISLGLGDSVSLARFGEPSTNILSLVSSLAAPIFQGNRLEGGVEQATAR